MFMNLISGNNPIAKCDHNKVVALVNDRDGKPRFIQYVKETNTITVLNDFGEKPVSIFDKVIWQTKICKKT